MEKVNAKDYLGKIVEIKIDRPLGRDIRSMVLCII